MHTVALASVEPSCKIRGRRVFHHSHPHDRAADFAYIPRGNGTAAWPELEVPASAPTHATLRNHRNSLSGISQSITHHSAGLPSFLDSLRSSWYAYLVLCTPPDLTVPVSSRNCGPRRWPLIPYRGARLLRRSGASTFKCRDSCPSRTMVRGCLPYEVRPNGSLLVLQ